MAVQRAIKCRDCALYRLCIPTCVGESERAALDAVIVRHPPIAKGQHWFRAGDAFDSIFAVRSGTVKIYRAADDGTERIAGVSFPGELIGLDAIDSSAHAYSAQALETTSVCEIPFAAIEQLSRHAPQLSQSLVRIMSREIQRDRALIVTLANKTAEQRVAWLLCRIARRLEQRRCASHEFALGMSRSDIASYLGLAVETVSRVFTRFRRRGWLGIEGKRVRLREPEQLHRLADSCAA